MFRKGLCGTHYKRLQRNKVVDGPILESVDAEEYVIRAGSDFLESPSEDDAVYAYRRKVFIRAIGVWASSLGWSPPQNKTKSRTR